MSKRRKIAAARSTAWFVIKIWKKKLRKKFSIGDPTVQIIIFPSQRLHWHPRNGFWRNFFRDITFELKSLKRAVGLWIQRSEFKSRWDLFFSGYLNKISQIFHNLWNHNYFLKNLSSKYLTTIIVSFLLQTLEQRLCVWLNLVFSWTVSDIKIWMVSDCHNLSGSYL